MIEEESDNYWVAQGDVFDCLALIPDGSIDCVITDPAYESLEKHRKKGTTTRLKNSKASSNEWFDIFPNESFPRLLDEFYRVMSKNSHLYVMCDDETSNILWDVNRRHCKFKWWKRIVWDKTKIGMGYHYRARYEFIAFLEKGKRKLNDLSMPDVLEIPRVWNGYPTEKPVGLMRKLIEQSTNEGETVLDPFMGSGSTGVAALDLGRNFVGFDKSEKACSISLSRLKQLEAA